MDSLIQERDEARCRAAECEEQLETILSALELTSKVASMDCTAYYQSQVGHIDVDHRQSENIVHVDHKHTDTHKDHSLNDTSNDNQIKPQHHTSNNDVGDNEETHRRPSFVIHLQRLGDRLKKMSRDTTSEQEREGEGEEQQKRRLRRNAHLRPLANIISSVHRLQSHLYSTQTEADTATEQAQSLQDDIGRFRQLKERNRKLEKAAKLLSKDNLVLTKELDGKEKELERMKIENDKFVKIMQDYVDSRRACELDSAQTHLKTELLRHEKILRTGLKSQSMDGCYEIEIRSVELDESEGKENVEIRGVQSSLQSVDEDKTLLEVMPAPLREDSITCFLPASSYQLSQSPEETKKGNPRSFLRVCRFMAEKRKKK